MIFTPHDNDHECLIRKRHHSFVHPLFNSDFILDVAIDRMSQEKEAQNVHCSPNAKYTKMHTKKKNYRQNLSVALKRTVTAVLNEKKTRNLIR